MTWELFLSFGSSINEGFANHFDMRTFINADWLTTKAMYFVCFDMMGIGFFYAGFVTTEHPAGANLIIFPQRIPKNINFSQIIFWNSPYTPHIESIA